MTVLDFSGALEARRRESCEPQVAPQALRLVVTPEASISALPLRAVPAGPTSERITHLLPERDWCESHDAPYDIVEEDEVETFRGERFRVYFLDCGHTVQVQIDVKVDL